MISWAARRMRHENQDVTTDWHWTTWSRRFAAYLGAEGSHHCRTRGKAQGVEVRR